MKLNKKGFTLTELLVVIAILGIITGLSIPLIRKLSATFELKKYQNYADGLLASAKIYNNSYSEDLFGHNENGCAYITYGQLVEKDLLKDIGIDDVSCNSDSTFVRVIKQRDKYSYAGFLGCGKKTNGKVENIEVSLPEANTEYAMDPTYCTGTLSNNLLIGVDTSDIGKTFNKKRKETHVIIRSGTGIDNNVVLYTTWSLDKNFDTATGWTQATFNTKSQEKQESELSKGNVVSAESNQLKTPENGNGQYYLLVRVDNLQDLYGSKWKNLSQPDSQYLSFGPFSVDNTPPVITAGIFKCDENKNKVGNTPLITKTSTELNGNTFNLSTMPGNNGGWLNSSIFPNGICFSMNLKDNYSLKSSTWKWNTAGLDENSSGVKELNGGSSVSNYDSSTTKETQRNTSITANGYRYIQLAVTDLAGNESTVKMKFNLDNSSPKIVVNAYKCDESKNKTGNAVATKTVNSGSATVNSTSFEGNHNGWLNKANYANGVCFNYKISDPNGIRSRYFNWNSSGLKENAEGYQNFVDTDQHSIYDTIETEKSYTASISADGHRYARISAKDNAGNETYINFDMKLDKVGPNAPTVKGYQKDSSANATSSSGLTEIASSTWSKKTIFTEATGSSDSLSGNVTYTYTTTGATQNETQTKNYRNINAQGESTISYKACDKAGNCSSQTSYVTKIDYTSPTIVAKVYKCDSNHKITGSAIASKTLSSGSTVVSLANVTGASNGWLNKDKYPYGVCFDFSYSDSVGLKRMDFNWNDSGLKENASGYKNLVDDNEHKTYGVYSAGTTSRDYSTYIGADGHRYVRITVKDHVENTTYIDFDMKIDRTAPTKPTITNPSGGNWTNKNFALTLASTDAISGINNCYYTYSSSATATGSDDSTQWKKSSGTVISKGFETSDFSAERNQDVYLKICDKAGNCSDKNSTRIRIDKTSPDTPTISATSDGSSYDGSSFTDEDIDVTLKSSDSSSGINYFQYTYNTSYTSIGTCTDHYDCWKTYLESDGAVYSDNNKTLKTDPFTAERDQNAYFRACDKAGNCSGVSSLRIKIKRDSGGSGGSGGGSSCTPDCGYPKKYEGTWGAGCSNGYYTQSDWDKHACNTDVSRGCKEWGNYTTSGGPWTKSNSACGGKDPCELYDSTNNTRYKYSGKGSCGSSGCNYSKRAKCTKGNPPEGQGLNVVYYCCK
ncbi:MAG: type II secretion system protein [Bacilli bacterium]|nr:type II secretion system protein [Bacilli bacterium]